MRISVNESDAGFQTLCAWGGPTAAIKVTLNGDEVFGCLTADEELGEVQVAVFDENGPNDGDEVRREWRRGKVKIHMPQMMVG